jgi:hypothetical protein
MDRLIFRDQFVGLSIPEERRQLWLRHLLTPGHSSS